MSQGDSDDALQNHLGVYHGTPTGTEATSVPWWDMELVAFAIAVGVSLAVVTGGSLGRILDTRVRLLWLLFGAFGVQLLLGVWSPGGGWSDGLGLGLYVGSFVALIVFCAANLRLTGMSIVLIGVAANLLPIALNGGMPVRLPADATDDQRRALEESVTHQPEGDDTLGFLGDIIVLPDPMNRSVSFGDLILGVGMVDVLFHASRARRRRVPAPVTGGEQSEGSDAGQGGVAPPDDLPERGDDAPVVKVRST